MKIFDGIRVLDVASFVAAPAAATLLGDWGADVIKVEPPQGDTWRNVTPRDQPNAVWLLTSHNKRGLVIDIKVEEGRTLLRQLIKQSDVVLFNFRAGQIKQFGLEYKELSRENPRLIYANISGYGEKGPEADRRAFDTTAWFARTGILDMLRDKDQAPPWPIIGLGDHMTAMTLFAGVCSALYSREQTGVGCEVTTSLIATGAWANGVPLQNALYGNDVSAVRNEVGWTNPFGSIYTTCDQRHLLFIMSNPMSEWPKLLDVIDRQEWAEDARFATREKQLENAALLRSMITEVIRSTSFSELAPRLDQSGIAWSEIQNLRQVTEDAQLRANDVVVPLTTEDERVTGAITGPLRFNGIAQNQITAPPDLGEHTDQVLSEFGFSTEDIEALRDAGALGKQVAPGISE